MTKNTRLFELDALRGIAALIVVFYHYFYRYDEIYGHADWLPVAWAKFGEYGVPLFFMVSGFVIFWTLNRIKTPADFIVSRFSRLYPPYWAAALLTFAVVTLIGLPGREVSTTDALMNVLMFQEYLRFKHIDGVYWTLTVELTFYFWMFVVYLWGKLDKAEYFLLAPLIANMLQALGIFELHWMINKIFIIPYIAFFLAGICFYKLINGGNIKRCVSIILLALFSIGFTHTLLELAIFAAVYLLFYLAVSGRLQVLAMKPFVFMGTISYSLYLLHQNIGYIIIRAFYENGLGPMLGILVALVVSISLAVVFLYLVEKPTLKYIRMAYKSWQAKKANWLMTRARDETN